MISSLNRLSPLVALLLVISYGTAWPEMDLVKADFGALYSAATLYKQGQSVYDLSAQCEVEQEIGATLCLPFSHPPILIPLLSLVVNENYRASYWRWVFVLAIVLLLCAVPIYLLTNDWQKCISLLVFFPIYLSMLQGQDSSFILMGVLWWVLFLIRGKDWLAGIALSIACLKPHIALALGLPMLFCRPRAFVSFALASTALALYSSLLVGLHGMKGIIDLTLLLASGHGWGVNQYMMSNITGLLARAGVNALWAWPFFMVGMICTSLIWRKRLDIATISLGVAISLLTVPHVHTQDVGLLIVAGVLFPAIVAPLASVALIVTNYHPLIIMTLIGLVGVFAWKKAFSNSPSEYADRF